MIFHAPCQFHIYCGAVLIRRAHVSYTEVHLKANVRLGLFGGTFDPIHNAHLTVAREAADQFQLEQVWFVPAANPPHKPTQSCADYEDRYRMTELACKADP